MSLNIDLSQLLSVATQIFNALVPILAVTAGIALGLALFHILQGVFRSIG